MTDTRRKGVSAALIAIVVGIAAAHGSGCSDDGPSATTTNPTTTSSSSSSGAGGSSSSSSSSSSGEGGGMMLMKGIDEAAQDVENPFDATPDPDGVNVYFTAADATQGTGVYKVPAAGGASSVVTVGDPFVSPFGIAISSDGATLFVADTASDHGVMDIEPVGQLLSLSTAGGAPTLVTGTEGLRPRGVEVAQEGGNDVIYFTGFQLDSTPAVFKVGKVGDPPTVVASGSPLAELGGIAIATNGDIYVADAGPLATGQANIFKIVNGTPVEIVSGLRVGFPIGIALNTAGTQLFVSGLNPDTLKDVVVQIDLATMMQTFYVGDMDTDISQFEEPAGLHRARNKDVFAWADSKAKPNPAQAAAGTVFTVVF